MENIQDGLAIARERIAQVAKTRTGFLDLGQLGLTVLPKELFQLKHLRCLNLGSAIKNSGYTVMATGNIAPNNLESSLWQLVELTALKVLLLNNTPLTNLKPLALLNGLIKLDCSVTQVSDLAPLAALTALQELDCSGTQVSDLTPLAALTSLQKLDCSGTQVSNLAPLAALTALQELDCSGTQVSNLAPIAALTALQGLYCSGTRVRNLISLAALTALQDLYCDKTRVRDLTPLAALKALQALTCTETKVRDLAPLADLTALLILDCSGTRVRDLTPLAALKALQVLICSGTRVRDLTPLAALTSLQKLDCSGTQVSDLAPLAALTALQELDCSHCEITQISENFWNKPSLAKIFLFDTKLPGIPNDVLSQDYYENCLKSFRAHLRDLEEGAVAHPDVKLMVLGNGRVGKTQICRRLRNEDYDSTVSSTHGIVVSSASLPDSAGNEWTKLQMWDFGGQDIYHGTHALFMRTRAVFLLVWSPKIENTDTHVHGSMIFRNRSLNFWLAYVRHFGGEDSPLLVVQARCDRPEDDARRLPVPDEALVDFKFCNSLMHYSAFNNRGRAALDEALREAVTWLGEHQGKALIGVGRLRVQQRLEAMREADSKVPLGERQYRTLSQEHFRQICDEEGGISSLGCLLEYFHNTGLVFYRKGLFHNRVILDQGWALEAVYAVFNREKSYEHLRWEKGRFTRALLELLVWENYSKEEQELFLSLMETCGVCFVHRQGNVKAEIEPEYIAPELLPEKAEVERELEEKWDPQAPKEEVKFEYELLHPGLLSSLVARIGSTAGINGLYWKGGVCVWEKTTRSHALIEQECIDDWRGVIRIQTQGGQASTLLERLWKILNEKHSIYGIRCREFPDMRPVHRPASFQTCEPEVTEAALQLEFAQEPATVREFCVSYAWGDQSPEGRKRECIIDQLCAEAEKRSIRILRDKNVLGLGERISKFMIRIGRADRVFVILSDKYLKSPYCMFELFEIWRNSRCDEDDFVKRLRVYTLPSAKIFSLMGRLEYAAYWEKEFDNVEAMLNKHGVTILGAAGFKKFKLMKDFAGHVGDILETLADVVQPRCFEELVRYGLDAE